MNFDFEIPKVDLFYMIFSFVFFSATDIVAIKATDGDATAANNVVTHTFSSKCLISEIVNSA